MSTDSNLPDEPEKPEEPQGSATPAEASQTPTGKLVEMPIEDELKDSYLTYAMSVIVSRALPDVRDGLKPSQRRILVAMNDLNLTPGAARVKCAKISGDTSGNYHPHGESVIYPTLVRMAQEWNMRHVLIDKQGNFGSIAGLPPAAMRYTEARMSPHAALMLEDLKLDTVDFVPTYDERRTEPTVLPSKFPNLLVNGANGIAVGMATSIPPHNLGEVCDALVRVIDEPDVSIDELLEIVPGPRLSHRRHHLRPGRHPPRLSHRPRQRSPSAPGRAIEEHGKPLSDRDHAKFPSSRPATGSRSGSPQLANEDSITGHFGHPQRERPERAGPADLRTEARRRSRDRAQPALRVLAAARQLLADLPGAGRRQAADACRSKSCCRSSSATARRLSAAGRCSCSAGPAAEAHGRRTAAGARQHRRSDPRHPHARQPRSRPRPA